MNQLCFGQTKWFPYKEVNVSFEMPNYSESFYFHSLVNCEAEISVWISHRFCNGSINQGNKSCIWKTTLNSQISESLQKVQWRKYSLSILLVLNRPSNIRKITHYGGCYDLCIKMAMSVNVNLDLNTFVSLRS